MRRGRNCQDQKRRLRKALTGLMVATALPFLAQAQDVIVFQNGDRLTGRIERLERGKLSFDSPIIDQSVQVDWDQIDRVESQRFFQFHTKAGERLLGRILEMSHEPAGDEIVILEGTSRRTFAHDEIVMVSQTVRGVGGLLTAQTGAGFSLAKANNQKQFSADASLSYETTGYLVSATLNSIFSTQQETTNTNRHNLRLGFVKNLSGRWGAGAIGDFLTSEEQKLDLRTVLGGGPTYTLIRSDDVILGTIGGAVWNNERFDPEAGLDSVNNEIEGLAGLDFSLFRFRQVGLESTVLVFPSLTTGGRVRMDWTSTLRLRILPKHKLWWNLNATINLDSEPPSLTPGSDYVTSTSISWEFP